MNCKDHFFKALIENKGQLNEIALGEKLQLTEDETRQIIAQLLLEHKIEYAFNGNCDYSVLKPNQKL